LEDFEVWLASEFKNEPHLPYMLKIIQRWKRHPQADKTWGIVREKLSTDDSPSARQSFIGLVLERAVVAKEIERVVEERPRVLKRVNRLAERKWKSGEHQLAASMKSAIAQHEIIATRLLGREKKTAARKLHMKGWSDKFNEVCGQPLDEVARVLTEVVFNVGVTTDAVRGAQRPSTRRGRSKPDRDTRGQK
jgi:hypothetical protein